MAISEPSPMVPEPSSSVPELYPLIAELCFIILQPCPIMVLPYGLNTLSHCSHETFVNVFLVFQNDGNFLPSDPSRIKEVNRDGLYLRRTTEVTTEVMM